MPQEQLVVKAKGQQRKVDDRKDRKPQRPHSPQGPKNSVRRKLPQDPATLPQVLKNDAHIASSSLPLKNSYINPCRAGAANLCLLSVAPTDIDLARV